MTAQITSPSPETTLNSILRGWDRRLRATHSLTWLPRAAMAGLAVGIALAIASRLRPWLLPETILLITGVAIALCIVLTLLVVWLLPRAPLATARRFDSLLGLRERTSAALELISGSIHTNDELMTRQIDDALAHAGTVRAGDYLPLRPRWQEWGIVAALGVVLALLLILPNVQAEEAAALDAQQAAITEAADDLRDIIRDVAADPNLSDDARRNLLETLQTSLEVLEQPDVTQQEAFAALSDAETALQEQSDQFNDAANSAQAALSAAADALRDLPSLGEQAADQSLSEMLETLAERSQEMGETERGLTAEQFESLSEFMAQENAELAQSMQDAAQSLQQGEMGAAQSAMQQAAQQAQEAEQASQQGQQAGEQMEQQAQQAQQAAQQVGQQQQGGQQGEQQAGQEQNSGQQEGEGGDPSEQQAPGDPSQQGEGEQGQPSDSAEGGEQGGLQEGQQGGDQGTQGSGQPGEGAGAPVQSDSAETGSNAGTAGGAGDESGDAGQEGGGGSQSEGQPPTNNPDGGGEVQYEPIYAPVRIGGDGAGNPEIQLEPDPSDMPVQEGDFSENPTGSASVPYNEVYSDYVNAANQALEADYVPLGLQDVVRDYFTGLEPGR